MEQKHMPRNGLCKLSFSWNLKIGEQAVNKNEQSRIEEYSSILINLIF